MKERRPPFRIFSSTIAHGFFSMSSGALLAQLVNLAFLPILSRLYTPAEFGVLALALGLSGIVAPALCMKFDSAVLLPSSHREVRSMVTLALVCAVLASTLWALISGFLIHLLLGSETPELLPAWIFLVSVLGGAFSLLSQLAIRSQRYKAVAARTFYQAAATSISQALLGVLKWGQGGLLVGTLIGRFAGVTSLAVTERVYFGRHGMRDLPPLCAKYWRFPAVFAPSSVLNSLGLQLPLLVLTVKFGVDFAGQLGMAERLVSIPITLVGVAMGQVFMGELSALHRNGSSESKRLFLRLSAYLSIVAVLGLGGMALVAPHVIPWLLGPQWRLSGELVTILALTGLFRLVASPLSGALMVMQRARANIAIDAVRVLLLSLGIIAVFTLPMDELTSTIALYGTLSIVYIVTWLYLLVAFRRSSR